MPGPRPGWRADWRPGTVVAMHQTPPPAVRARTRCAAGGGSPPCAAGPLPGQPAPGCGSFRGRDGGSLRGTPRTGSGPSIRLRPSHRRAPQIGVDQALPSRSTWTAATIDHGEPGDRPGARPGGLTLWDDCMSFPDLLVMRVAALLDAYGSSTCPGRHTAGRRSTRQPASSCSTRSTTWTACSPSIVRPVTTRSSRAQCSRRVRITSLARWTGLHRDRGGDGGSRLFRRPRTVARTPGRPGRYHPGRPICCRKWELGASAPVADATTRGDVYRGASAHRSGEH